MTQKWLHVIGIAMLIVSLASCGKAAPTAMPAATATSQASEPTATSQASESTATFQVATPSATPLPTATPQAPTATPVPTPTPTPEPPRASARIGPEGGSITSLDGTMRLDLPSEALDAPLQVSLISPSTEVEAGLASPVLHIQTEPSLSMPLPVAARLTWLQAPEGAQRPCLARRVAAAGALYDDAGEPVPPLAYWLPLAHTRLDENGEPSVWLASFSEYAGVTAPSPECVPPPESLVPPPPPDGFVYVGREVVINAVYSSEHSTVPLSRPQSPDDLVVVRNPISRAKDAALECDVVVMHIFASVAQIDPQSGECVPSAEALQPPPAPPGYEYAGRQVSINSAFDGALSTLPETWQDVPGQLVFISSDSQAGDMALKCDVIVAHFFVPKASEPVQSPAECEPTVEQLQPLPAPDGYEYVGREVTVNAVYRSDLSDVPAGYVPSSADLVMPSSNTRSRNGVQICDVVVVHHFAPKGRGTCGPTAEQLSPPETPDGYVYVGRDVVVNGVLEAELSTVPLEREASPQDLSFIQSTTQSKDGATQCDVIVRHLFAPIPYGGYPLPPELLLPPPGPKCGYYLGYEALVGWNLVDSTFTTDTPLKSAVEVYVSAEEVGLGAAAPVTMTVGHLFYPAVCPPCKTTVSAAEPPQATEDEQGKTVLTFGPGANLSTDDADRLRKIATGSIRSSTGEQSFVLPPDTTWAQEGGQIAINLSPLHCE